MYPCGLWSSFFVSEDVSAVRPVAVKLVVNSVRLITGCGIEPTAYFSVMQLVTTIGNWTVSEVLRSILIESSSIVWYIVRYLTDW